MRFTYIHLHMSGKVIDIENAVISINETTLLSEAMKRANVTVLTAQILVNCLVNKEVKISDFDLIIMDECHHTDLKHPYNQLMKVSLLLIILTR